MITQIHLNFSEKKISLLKNPWEITNVAQVKPQNICFLTTKLGKRLWGNSEQKSPGWNCVAISSELKHSLLEVGREALTVNSEEQQRHWSPFLSLEEISGDSEAPKMQLLLLSAHAGVKFLVMQLTLHYPCFCKCTPHPHCRK